MGITRSSDDQLVSEMATEAEVAAAISDHVVNYHANSNAAILYADVDQSAALAVNATLTVPAYTVGAGSGGQWFRWWYNGQLMRPGASYDYVEVGSTGSTSTTIQIKREIAANSSLSFAVSVIGSFGGTGTKWYNGAGAPSSSVGVNGDYFLNTNNGDVYVKVSGSWGSPIENLTGPAGPSGVVSATSPVSYNSGTQTVSLLTNVDFNINGQVVGRGGGAVSTNTAHGTSALAANTTGLQNTAVGFQALKSATDGSYSTAIGHNVLSSASNSGFRNTGVGAACLASNTSASGNTAVGFNAMTANTTGGNNTSVGASSLSSNTTGANNAAFGGGVLSQNSSGSDNCGVGAAALAGNQSGLYNTAVGRQAAQFTAAGSHNTAVGYQAWGGSSQPFFTSVSNVTAVGSQSLLDNYAANNTAIGFNALRYQMDGTTANATFTNCSGLGQDTRVSGSNQVALGNSATTTYAYGAVQDRSDLRDKADVRDTVLGLSFLKALRPVDFRWDYRDDYVDTVETTDDEGTTTLSSVAVPKDGSRKRNRYHHGLIAQEVKSVLDADGVDFGGFQDHSINGGADVLSIGYTELIAPLIKAVQELAARVEALEAGGANGNH